MTVSKTLGTAQPVVNTATKLYTAPAGLGAAISRLVVNNRVTNTLPSNIKVEVRVGGAAAVSSFVWEMNVFPNNPLEFGSFNIGQTDEIWVTTDQANTNFNLFGIEL